MCRMVAEDGIEHMVATLHANDECKYDRVDLRRILDELRMRVGSSPKLSLGCDFYLS
jgi:hypothetical protein